MRIRSIIIAGFALLGLRAASAAPLGTAFTYQGQLTASGQPANGTHDLKFTLYDAASSTTAVAGPVTNSPVGVTNRLFTTTLDVGGGVFTGEARWLEIAVSCNRVVADFTLLSPRQSLLPPPCAMYAPSAGPAPTTKCRLQLPCLARAEPCG